MAMILATVPDDLLPIYSSFKLNKTKENTAIISKIDKQAREFQIEQRLDNVSIDDLQNELSSNEPRFVLLSYTLHHDDGRISYPYCLIFSSPRGSPPELKMMYASSMNYFIATCQVTKHFEVHDLDELTEDWLKEQMHKKGY